MLHDLKVLRPYFAELKTGAKRFEVRLNDRAFQPGDTLRLWEVDDNDGKTGSRLDFVVPYILRGGQYGIAADHVVMSLLPLQTGCDCKRCEHDGHGHIECAYCRETVSNHGQTFVSIQAMEETGHTVDAPCEVYEEPDVSTKWLKMLSEFISQWLMLPAKTREVVALRFIDLCSDTRHTYTHIGFELHITAQAAEQRMREAMATSDAIKSMFASKAAKQLARKTRGPIEEQGANDADE